MSATPFGKKPGSGAVQEPPADFEVLPPEGKGGASARPGVPGSREELISRLIAYVMDNLVKVPGTKARVGINPFLDLIPFVGDGAAMFISAATILEGARRGVPKVVLTRMGMNILLNGPSWHPSGRGRGVRLLVPAVVAQLPTPAQACAAAGRFRRSHPARMRRAIVLFVVGLLAVVLVADRVGFIVMGWHVLTSLLRTIAPAGA